MPPLTILPMGLFFPVKAKTSAFWICPYGSVFVFCEYFLFIFFYSTPRLPPVFPFALLGFCSGFLEVQRTLVCWFMFWLRPPGPFFWLFVAVWFSTFTFSQPLSVCFPGALCDYKLVPFFSRARPCFYSFILLISALHVFPSFPRSPLLVPSSLFFFCIKCSTGSRFGGVLPFFSWILFFFAFCVVFISSRWLPCLVSFPG